MTTLLPLLLLLAKAEVTGGVRTEVQAGEAPTVSDPNPSFYVAALLKPDLTLRLWSPTTETRATETPRLLLRRPNVADLNRPLYLNMFQVEHKGHRGARLNWELQLTSTVGEVDYAALTQILGQQAALPATLNLFTADGSAEVGWRLSRRWLFATRVGVLRRQPLGSTQSGGLTLPTETDESLEPRLEYAVSSRQTGLVRAKLAHYQMTGSVVLEAMEVELRLGWRYRLSRRHQLQLAAGAAFATAQNRSDPSRPWTTLSPLAEAYLLSAARLSPGTLVRGRAGGEVLWYLDPVLGVSLPRGEINANVTAEIGPTWLLEVYIQAATNLSRHPLPNSPTETVISAGVPLRYRVAQHWSVELGGRYSERGPHLNAPGFSFRQREILGYLAVSATTQ